MSTLTILKRRKWATVSIQSKDKLQNSFCLKFFETKRNEQSLKDLQGIELIARRQKLIELTHKSEHDWATVNEYIDDELASDEDAS